MVGVQGLKGQFEDLLVGTRMVPNGVVSGFSRTRYLNAEQLVKPSET